MTSDIVPKANPFNEQITDDAGDELEHGAPDEPGQGAEDREGVLLNPDDMSLLADAILGGTSYLPHREAAERVKAALAQPGPRETGLREALRPFAEFADPRDVVPENHVITQGSSMAKRQLTMGDCYKARAALSDPLSDFGWDVWRQEAGFVIKAARAALTDTAETGGEAMARHVFDIDHMSMEDD